MGWRGEANGWRKISPSLDRAKMKRGRQLPLSPKQNKPSGQEQPGAGGPRGEAVGFSNPVLPGSPRPSQGSYAGLGRVFLPLRSWASAGVGSAPACLRGRRGELDREPRSALLSETLPGRSLDARVLGGPGAAGGEVLPDRGGPRDPCSLSRALAWTPAGAESPWAADECPGPHPHRDCHPLPPTS